MAKKAKVVTGAIPNTIEIDPKFLNFTTLKKSLIPEGSSLKILKVYYEADVTEAVNHLDPIDLLGNGSYMMADSLVNRHRLGNPVIDLTNPVIDQQFDKITDKLIALNSTRFAALRQRIKYRIKKINIMDKSTGKVYQFVNTTMNGISRLILTTVNNVSIDSDASRETLPELIKALSEIFYMSCYYKRSKVKAAEHCMSRAMYAAQMKKVE